ncbi:MAG: hypothetical protein Pg6B_11190 [Candidatus Azobacteroides pseudotrichonymphae]|uniref:DUF1492 domain-containing protein n=1 Tax=Candidatus Improbicoccus pseudotrichonymphae TaxID=3033792 RepID=A0AA48KX86_9FIRM|nr:MAG: DUF1492 domain-containing protein [Candidatus Improbicoccus pseudotrichonymphae]GMO39089.1 MAG: hypothetical protein Pg6B_11190 [Candidatus Azobacteroides pseudotrichonymphae]
MSIKEVKEFLNQSYKIEKRIDSKLEQIKTLKVLAEKVNSVFSDMPKNPAMNPHVMEETISKLVDLEAEISDDLKDLVKTKEEAIHFIKSIENKEFQIILELRYLCHKSWEQITRELSYDIRHVFRLHGLALKFVSNLKDVSKCH